MKKRTVFIMMMAPLIALGSLFSDRSGEIFQTTREGPGELSLGSRRLDLQRCLPELPSVP